MPIPVPKPPPKQKKKQTCLKAKKPLKSNTKLKTKTRLKVKTTDTIPKTVVAEVNARDGLICQDCGQPVTEAERPYHHIQFRSHRYDPMVRLWISEADWVMALVWFEFHSKENIITLGTFCGCGQKPHDYKQERYRWEKWRDKKYYKEWENAKR